MTAVVLADDPDVFAGGGIMSGVPYACATDVASAFTCMSSDQRKTPSSGGRPGAEREPRLDGAMGPRVAIWHGTADFTVQQVNASEARDQWTNVWGVGQTPSSTVTLPGNGSGSTTLTVYADAGGNPAVELYLVQGMGHGMAVDPGSATEQCGTSGTYFLGYICSAYYTALFWGLSGGAARTG